MNNLEKIIKYALSRPPSSAGRRIRSERDLAALLKANHSKVRKSLSELVHKGGRSRSAKTLSQFGSGFWEQVTVNILN